MAEEGVKLDSETIRKTLEQARKTSELFVKDLEHRYGVNKAAVLSECANLLGMYQFFPPLQDVALRLVTSVARDYGIADAEITRLMLQMTEMRKVEFGPTRKLDA